MKKNIIFFAAIVLLQFSLFLINTNSVSGQTLAAGGYHSAFLCFSDSTCFATGDNSNYKLGDSSGATYRIVPAYVHGYKNVGYLNGIIAIASKWNTTIALRKDSTVWGWGYGYYGILGTAYYTNARTPVPINYLSGIIAIASGYQTTVALKSDSTVWDLGSYLGDSSNSGGYNGKPVKVHGPDNRFLTGVVGIASGSDFSMALRKDGTVWVWGIYNIVPVMVQNLTDVKAIGCGSILKVAVKKDGTVWTWSTGSPVQVQGLSDIIQVDYGISHGLALKKDGTVWGWGANNYGQLGDTAIGQSTTGIQVRSGSDTGVLGNAVEVRCGSYFSMARLSDGTVRTWGYNSLGQLGDGSFTRRYLPIQPIQKPAISISTSATNICPGTSVQFIATSYNGGTTPFYQWKINGKNVGANSSAFTADSLHNNDTVSCTLLSNGSCLTSTLVTSNLYRVTITPSVTYPVTITASDTLACPNTNITFTASSTVNALSNFQWKINDVAKGSNSSAFGGQLKDGDKVYCIMTYNGGGCPLPYTSNTVTVKIVNSITDSVNINANFTTICTGTPVTFTANAKNMGSAPSYKWTLNNAVVGTNKPTYVSNYLNNGDVVRLIMNSYLACASPRPDTSNAIIINVVPSLAVSLNITTSADTICLGSPVTFQANATNGGPAPFFQWQIDRKNTGLNNTQFVTDSLANGDTVLCILTSGFSCATGSPASSNSIPVFVKSLPQPFIGNDTTVCLGTLVSLSPGSQYVTYLWSTGETTAVINADTTGVYKVTVAGSNGCVNSDSIHLQEAICTETNTSFGEEKFHIYPNPNNGNFTITISTDNLQVDRIEIFGCIGQLLKTFAFNNSNSSNTFEINTHDLAASIYFVKIISNKGTWTNKLVIEK